MANEVAGVGSFQEALLTGWHEGRRNGIADHFIHKLDTLVALFQRFHVTDDPTVLPLSACNTTTPVHGDVRPDANLDDASVRPEREILSASHTSR